MNLVKAALLVSYPLCTTPQNIVHPLGADPKRCSYVRGPPEDWCIVASGHSFYRYTPPMHR